MQVVIYIDGSSRPNPGKSGWGAHGYLFEEVSVTPRKYNDQYITANGYMDKQTFQKHNESVVPIEFYDFCVFEKDCNTNNAAELHALYRVLTYFKNTALKSLDIFTDSEYVRKGLTEYTKTWIQNNWKRTDGKDILHTEVWKEILKLEKDYADKGIRLDLHWVKGHADTYGNILADKLASIAAYYGYADVDIKDYSVVPAIDYLNKEPLRHPFMASKRAYFNTTNISDDVGLYFLSDPSDDTDIGRKLPEALYSVILYDDSDPVIEIVKERHRSIYGEVTRTAMIKLDRVYEKDLYPYLAKYKHPCLNVASENYEGLNFIDGRNITTTISPASLSLKAMETFSFLEGLVRSYKDNTLLPEYNVIDITEIFYDITEKKTILKDKFIVGYRDITIDINVNNRSLSIPLCLGGDLLPRNNLKRLEGSKPTLKLLVWEESPLSYCYAIITSITGAVGVWSNYYSNRVLKCQNST